MPRGIYMGWGNKKWVYFLPLILFLYVPIKLKGIDKTFLIFLLNINSLGESGIVWHYHTVRQYLNRRYLCYELITAYLVLFAGICILKLIKKRGIQKNNDEG
jgi:hypothetical protein